jgi:phosphoglycerol transferase MdoB-like AlkP superfamily enzyme
MTIFNLILFMVFASFSRLVLFVFALYEKQIDFNIIDVTKVISFGIVNDVITACYVVSIFNLFRLFLPDKNNIIYNALINIIYFVMIFAFCFLVGSEFTFWLEFSTRFNFIAVDYLVYTHEVIKNIVESYPLFEIILVMLFFTTLIFVIIYPYLQIYLFKRINYSVKLKEFILFVCLSCLSFYFYNPKFTDIKNNNYLSELTKNGLYNLFSAFTQNEIDYYNFYPVRDRATALNELSDYINNNNQKINPQILSRAIKAKEATKDYNIFLIAVESLSADYLTTNYQDKPLTPKLSQLIKESLYFSEVYATGTRTIRGLEALSLSIPPLPGQAILRRKNNENLFSIATVLAKENYDIKFIYGGYGYFDNMNYFFSNNGFKIVDRNIIPENEISFSNAWGISDEDLYYQAIKQADDSYAKNEKFFSLLMTTSNHRPYTYPEGKIDIPSKSNREGGVKYTDYALGEFIKLAKTKPWFDNTIFVITADHCAGSAGKIALPPHKYNIPLIFYAPKIIKPGIIDKLSSQIDVAPTILGLLNISYESRFFGNDILSKNYQNAFISTYQKLGYMEKDKLVILSPGKIIQTYNLSKNKILTETKADPVIINRAIDYYQSIYYLYKDKLLTGKNAQ